VARQWTRSHRSRKGARTAPDQTSGFGVLLGLLGLSMLANVWSAALIIVNNSGGNFVLGVSVLEKGKLERFRAQVEQQVYANHQKMRHQESLNLQTHSLYVQQEQLRVLQERLGTPQGYAAPYPPPNQYQAGPSSTQPVAQPPFAGPPATQWNALLRTVNHPTTTADGSRASGSRRLIGSRTGRPRRSRRRQAPAPPLPPRCRRSPPALRESPAAQACSRSRRSRPGSTAPSRRPAATR